MDDIEAEFVMDAVEFVADRGYRFLPLYAFDPETGAWSHREYRERHEPFAVEAALEAAGCEETALPAETRATLYAGCLADAQDWAARLGEPPAGGADPTEERFGELQFFNLV